MKALAITFKKSFFLYILTLSFSSLAVYFNQNLTLILTVFNLAIIYLLFFKVDYGDMIVHIKKRIREVHGDDEKKYVNQFLGKVYFYTVLKTTLGVSLVLSFFIIFLAFVSPFRLKYVEGQEILYYSPAWSFLWDFLSLNNKEDLFRVGRIAILLQLALQALYLIFKESFLEAKRKYAKLEGNEV